MGKRGHEETLKTKRKEASEGDENILLSDAGHVLISLPFSLHLLKCFSSPINYLRSSLHLESSLTPYNT